MRVITFGVWDMMHLGHLSMLKRASGYGMSLTVGVCSDELVLHQKGREPLMSEEHRLALINSNKYVNAAFIYRDTDYLYWFKEYGGDVLVVGPDFRANIPGMVVLERLPGVSTTEIYEGILRR